MVLGQTRFVINFVDFFNSPLDAFLPRSALCGVFYIRAFCTAAAKSQLTLSFMFRLFI
jgi:hypothetical protein